MKSIMGGGMLGKIAKLGDAYLSVEVANGVEVQIQRSCRDPGSAQRHDQVISCGPNKLTPPSGRHAKPVQQAPDLTAAGFATAFDAVFDIGAHPMNRYPIWKYVIIVIMLAAWNHLQPAQPVW
jgi:hypothetical protein